MSSSGYYAVTASIAIIMLCLQNSDILFTNIKNHSNQVWRTYKKLLYVILVFHLTDVLWGAFADHNMITAMFIDSLFYFEAMALCVLLWTHYAVNYVGRFGWPATLLIRFGKLFFAVLTGMVIANIFTPVLFSIDKDGTYHALQLRWIIHGVQIMLVLAISVYCFAAYNKKENSQIKNRYRTIGWFGLIMAIFLFAQLWLPLLPLYTIAYMVGTCMVRTFVVNDEKEEYKKQLEEAYEREKQQLQELIDVRRTAYVDPLTGIKNKSAYVEFETYKNLEMQNGDSKEFAVGVCDINGLKIVNDTLGHEKGDEFIIEGCQAICKHFSHSPVYRIGGDEFVVIFQKNSYKTRKELIKKFDEMMNRNNQEGKVVIAMGMSEYIPGDDYTFNDVFARADEKMYKRKRELKEVKEFQKEG